MKARVRVLRLARSCLKRAAQWLITKAKQQQQKRLAAALGGQGDSHGHDERNCKAIAKSTRKPCGNLALSGSQYCHCHQKGKSKGVIYFASKIARWAAKIIVESFSRGRSLPRNSLGSRQRILKEPRRHTKRKTITHHNTHARTKAADFRLPNLRSTKAAVWNFREHKDAYTGFTRYQMRDSPIDLDHVLELHVARDSFDRIRFTGVGRRRKRAAAKERFTGLLNRPSNLNVTTSEINQIKFRGIYGFQRDYLAGVCSDAGLVHYLEAANYKSKRLSRKTTACIQSEVVRSYDALSNSLRDEDGVEGQMLDLLHDNMTAMRLF